MVWELRAYCKVSCCFRNWAIFILIRHQTSFRNRSLFFLLPNKSSPDCKVGERGDRLYGVGAVRLLPTSSGVWVASLVPSGPHSCTTDGLTSHFIGEEPEEQGSEATCLGHRRQSRRVLAAGLLCFPLLCLFTSARREHEEM